MNLLSYLAKVNWQALSFRAPKHLKSSWVYFRTGKAKNQARCHSKPKLGLWRGVVWIHPPQSVFLEGAVLRRNFSHILSGTLTSNRTMLVILLTSPASLSPTWSLSLSIAVFNIVWFFLLL